MKQTASRMWLPLVGSLLLTLSLVLSVRAARETKLVNDPHDVAAYAKAFGVSNEVSAERLALQHAAGDLNAILLKQLPAEQFGGLWIEHTPTFRVVVGVTSKDVRLNIQDKQLQAVTTIKPVRWSLTTLQAIQKETIAQLRDIKMSYSMGISAADNGIQLFVTDIGRFQSLLDQNGIQLSPPIRLVEYGGLSQKPAPTKPTDNPPTTPGRYMFAGRHISIASTGTCTTGFTVSANGKTGVSTGSHCSSSNASTFTYLPDETYVGSNFVMFQNRWEDGSHDLQWHTTVEIDANLQFDGLDDDITPFYRYIKNIRLDAQQPQGSLACKHGTTTGFTCGMIMYKNYMSTSSNCPATDPVWIVTYPINGQFPDQSQEGDSGGSVFVGSNALGLIKCKADLSNGQTAMIYMPTDFFADEGLNINTSDSPSLVVYRSDNGGWQNWRFDGETAGSDTAILPQRIRRLAMRLGDMPGRFICYDVYTDLANGWEGELCNGIGTVVGAEIYAVRIRLEGVPAGCHVEYEGRFRNQGWLTPVQDNTILGNPGDMKKLDALRVQLVGCG